MVYEVRRGGGSSASIRYYAEHNARLALDRFLSEHEYIVGLHNETSFEVENIKSRRVFAYTVEPHMVFDVTSEGSYATVV